MILFRADANKSIGTGHIMRCLSIAGAFRDLGEECIFITADNSPEELIKSKGFANEILHSVCTDMPSELPVFEEVIDRFKPGVIFVDSYYVTREYLSAIKAKAKLAYVDDVAAFAYPCDCLINYNIYGPDVDYETIYNGAIPQLLLGPQYAPLRAEFKGIPPKIIKNEVEDILISTGGADPQKINEVILEKTCSEFPDISFHFVVGPLNPHIDRIQRKAEAVPNAVLHVNEKDMKGLMESCDVAVSAAGSTLYELCACGVPTVTYSFADNQIAAAEQFEKEGIMLSAGDCRMNNTFADTIGNCIFELINSKSVRKELSAIMQKMVDGYGAERLAKIVLEELQVK